MNLVPEDPNITLVCTYALWLHPNVGSEIMSERKKYS